MIEWFIFAVLCGFVLGWGTNVVFTWLVKREALSMVNRGKGIASGEKKQIIKSDKVALALEIKEAMTTEGDFIKEKLPKLATALTNHPDASEDLLKMAMKYL